MYEVMLLHILLVYTSNERMPDKNEVAYIALTTILFLSTHNTDSGKTKTLQVAVVIMILLIAFITGHVDMLSKKNTDYLSILLFRLLRDQCYRADSSNMIYKPIMLFGKQLVPFYHRWIGTHIRFN